MTPEQLREEADVCEQDYAAGHPIDIGAPEFIRLARAHAAALEELAAHHAGQFCPYCNPCRRANEITPLEDALRSLASWLSVGGHNAPTVDAKEFEARIRDGVEIACNVAEDRAERAEAALAESERRAERLKFHAEAMAGAWEKLDFDDGDSEDAMEEAVFAYRADKGE